MELDDSEETLPEGMSPATALFSVFERYVNLMTEEMMRHIISELKETGTQSINYNHLRSIFHEDLRQFVRDLLGPFDNYGAVLPPGVLAYKIIEAESMKDIRNGTDYYWQLWLDYVKASSPT